MNIAHFRSLHAHARLSRPGAQRGVVLFIALLVMVALSLAGIALIRSADTATIVAGNLAFKQTAASAADRSIEQAIDRLFNPVAAPALPAPKIVDKTVNDPLQGYYACVQDTLGVCLRVIDPSAPIPEIPTVLTTKEAAKKAADDGLIAAVPIDAASNLSYYVIERMCINAGPAISNNCNLTTPTGGALGADAGTQHYEGLVRPGSTFYRVTVRVEGPRNTVAYAQAILQ